MSETETVTAEAAAAIVRQERDDRSKRVAEALQKLLDDNKCRLHFVQQWADGQPQQGQWLIEAM